MIDLALFRHLGFSAGLAAAFLTFIAMASNMFLVPFFLQLQLGFSPAKAGLFMMAVPLAILWSAPVGGWLSDKLGPRLPATTGLTMVAASVFLLASIRAGADEASLIAVLTLYGAGAGLFQSPNNSGVLSAVPAGGLGTASGTLATMRQVGQVAGIAIAATVWATSERSALSSGLAEAAAQASGFRDAFLVLAAAAVLAMIASALRGGRDTSMAGEQVELPAHPEIGTERSLTK